MSITPGTPKTPAITALKTLTPKVKPMLSPKILTINKIRKPKAVLISILKMNFMGFDKSFTTATHIIAMAVKISTVVTGLVHREFKKSLMENPFFQHGIKAEIG